MWRKPLAVVNDTSSLSLDEVAAAVIVSEVYVLVSMNRMKASALDEVLLVAPRTRNGHRFWDNNYLHESHLRTRSPTTYRAQAQTIEYYVVDILDHQHRPLEVDN